MHKPKIFIMKKFSVQNWEKKTDRNWNLIANTLVYTLPLYNSVILKMPIPDNVKTWVLIGLDTLVVIFKMISRLTLDSKYYEQTSG